jgi:hypothetical protein
VVLLLVAAGWLSILGNSPPPQTHKKPGAKTGPVLVFIERKEWDSGCAGEGALSVPVRKISLFAGDKLLHEVECEDGTDCLPRLQIPPDNVTCRIDVPPGQTSPSDSGAPPLDSGPPPSDSDAAPPPFLPPETWTCPGPDGRPIAIRYTKSRALDRSGYDLCSNESTIYKMVFETAAGQQGTYEYQVEVEPPSGYFGC